MNIKGVSDLLKVAPSKIRYYEDMGLINIKRDTNGYRNLQMKM